MLIWQAPDLTVGTVHGWIYTNERQILDDFTAFGQQVAGYVCFSEVRFSSAFYRQNLAFPWNVPPRGGGGGYLGKFLLPHFSLFCGQL